tara:strand:- start:7 stop:1935 length:1929 start_codon:yes stop_codon:yes gene_type:complete
MKKIKLIICSVLLLIANVNAANYNIDSGNYYYSPSSLTINVGDTVTWTNVQGYHNVNFDINTITSTSFNNPVSFISSPTGMGVMYTHVFAVSGTYEYDCSVGSHALNGMVGTVIVNGAPSNTIYDIVSNSPVHNYLKICLDTTSLDAVFSDVNQDLTLFAPSDVAFLALPPGTVTALLMDLTLLTDILKHHAVQGTALAGSLTNNQVITTLLGTDVTVTINSAGIFIDNAQVTVSDIIADNGVVHVIDAVLLPPMDCNSVIDGTALVDSCGTCQQAYLYNFQTNVPTFVDNANVLVAGVDYDPATQALIFPNDPMNPLWVSDPALCTNSIYDIVSNSADHTTLKAAVDACGLDSFLSDPGSLTLFAPTDAAFNLLPAGTVAALLADIPALTDILKHHVIGASVMSSALSNNQVVTTLLGTDVTVTINSTGVFIDNAQVIVADILADNGVVHVIDAVLIPTASIYDIVSNSSNHTTLKVAIDACALNGVLSDPGSLTLFAPTDAAFDLLPAGTVTALLADIPLLTDILKHHVVGASVMSGMLSNNQVVTTLLGTDITVTINSMGVYIDNAMVTVADIVADNGVVHVIDAVLIPTTTDIIDYNNLEKTYLYSVNILGEKVSNNLKNQIIFNIFKDGSVEKVFNK